MARFASACSQSKQANLPRVVGSWLRCKRGHLAMINFPRWKEECAEDQMWAKRLFAKMNPSSVLFFSPRRVQFETQSAGSHLKGERGRLLRQLVPTFICMETQNQKDWRWTLFKIGVTGHPQDHIRRRALDFGCKDYFRAERTVTSAQHIELYTEKEKAEGKQGHSTLVWKYR